jgi:hypothetical protein
MMQYHLDSRGPEEMIPEHHLLVLNTENSAEMRGTLLCLVLLRSTAYPSKNNGHFYIEGLLHKKLVVAGLKK